MAHIEIKCDGVKATSIVVDGRDITKSVLQDGFWIEPNDVGRHQPAKVHMVLVADTLDIDLPGSVVVATREGGA